MTDIAEKQEADKKWLWYSGQDDEFYTNGPFATREEAIEALDGYGGHIIEAAPREVRFSANSLIEHQYFDNDDYFTGEHRGPDRAGGADVVAQADAELQTLLDDWLDRWRHTFVKPEVFRCARKGECIQPYWMDAGPLSDEEKVELRELEEQSAAGIGTLESSVRMYELGARANHFANAPDGEASHD